MLPAIFNNQPIRQAEQDSKIAIDTLSLASMFEKSHKHVLRDIQKLISQSSHEAELSSFYAEHFIASTYTDSRGRTQPKFLLTREGFSLLAMGFTGAKAQLFKIRYIQADQAIEALTKQTLKLTSGGQHHA